MLGLACLMQLAFSKMNGAGNDFVLIDNRNDLVSLSREQVARLCDRQRGVGADGLILLRGCPDGEADWAWDFYNGDGSDAEMCGNGARCFARFIARRVGVNSEISFLTGCGVIRAVLDGERVTVSLIDPCDLRLNEEVSLSVGTRAIHSLNTGVPHAILMVEDADAAMVDSLGNEIRHHQHFAPAGTNVNFVEILEPEHIRVRTYERGVGETLACGTGVSASAIIASRLEGFSSPVKVDVLGGDTLEVSFDDNLRSVQLTGPAEFVFDGVIDV